METVYIETTVVGNIAGRMHPEQRIAAKQAATREWWETAQARYRIFASVMVVSECGDGDSAAATERLRVLDGVGVP